MSERKQPELADVAWDMARASAGLLLGRMREIEERVEDQRLWWPMLRTVLERFAEAERPKPKEG